MNQKIILFFFRTIGEPVARKNRQNDNLIYRLDYEASRPVVP